MISCPVCLSAPSGRSALRCPCGRLRVGRDGARFGEPSGRSSPSLSLRPGGGPELRTGLGSWALDEGSGSAEAWISSWSASERESWLALEVLEA